MCACRLISETCRPYGSSFVRWFAHPRNNRLLRGEHNYASLCGAPQSIKVRPRAGTAGDSAQGAGDKECISARAGHASDSWKRRPDRRDRVPGRLRAAQVGHRDLQGRSPGVRGRLQPAGASRLSPARAPGGTGRILRAWRRAGEGRRAGGRRRICRRPSRQRWNKRWG